MSTFISSSSFLELGSFIESDGAKRFEIGGLGIVFGIDQGLLGVGMEVSHIDRDAASLIH